MSKVASASAVLALIKSSPALTGLVEGSAVVPIEDARNRLQPLAQSQVETMARGFSTRLKSKLIETCKPGWQRG